MKATNQFWKEFIHIFRKQPILWDVNHEHYRNKHNPLKLEAYRELTEKFKEIDPNVTSLDVKRKIDSLRSSFRKENRRAKECKQQGQPFISALCYYDELNFLREHEVVDVSSDDDDDKDDDMDDDRHDDMNEVRSTISAPEWTQTKSLELARSFQRHELLWKLKHPFHFHRSKKQEAWEEIAREINMETEDCKRKMTSLQSSFRREAAKVRKAHATWSGIGDKNESSWFAYKALRFMERKGQDDSKISSNTSLEINNAESPKGNEAPTYEFVHTALLQDTPRNENRTSPYSTESLDEMPPPLEIRKKIKASATPSRKEESELDLFGKLVAKKLEGYSDNVSSIVQEELMKILFKADRGYFNMANQQPHLDEYRPQTISHSNQQIYHQQQPYQALSTATTSTPHSSSVEQYTDPFASTPNTSNFTNSFKSEN